MQTSVAERTQPVMCPRVLRVRSIQYLFSLSLGTLVFTAIALMILLKELPSTASEIALSVAVFSLYLYLIYAIFRLVPYLNWEIQVYPDAILWMSHQNRKTILLTDIQKVSIKTYWIFGGRFSITTRGGQVFKFPLGLERPEYLLDVVYASNPSLCTPKEYQRYRKLAMAIDQVNQRKMENASRFPYLLLKYVFFSLGLYLVANLGHLLPLEIRFHHFILMNLLAGVILYLISEMAITINYIEGLEQKDLRSRHYHFESAVTRITNWLYFLVSPTMITMMIAFHFVQRYWINH